MPKNPNRSTQHETTKPAEPVEVSPQDEQAAITNYVGTVMADPQAWLKSLPPPEPEPDLEFNVQIVKFQEIAGANRTSQIDNTPASLTMDMLNDGWSIDGDPIVCPPFAMITFSREVQAAESEPAQDEQ